MSPANIDVRLAVVGTTGAVGRIVCQLLAERSFPASSVKFLASQRSAKETIDYRGCASPVEVTTESSFDDVDLVIASTPDDVARQVVDWATSAGAVVVDESGAHRMLEHVPLVVPEVNAHALSSHRGLIASPNCTTTQMVVCLAPLHREATLRRVVVTTYQAASGAGVAGERELLEGCRQVLAGQAPVPAAFAHRLAFNVIPQIGRPGQGGYTSEELKMVHETHKILGDDSIAICPTCVRVPVRNCHSASILVQTAQPLSAERARKIFQSAEGITVLDDLDGNQYPMPINGDQRDDVLVGRIRRDTSCDNGLVFWCTSDNLRKGAATNAVQIAELLVAGRHLPCGISN